jgi:hypothetical protein
VLLSNHIFFLCEWNLLECWTTDDCPKRYFAPYSFVNSCIEEGQIRITPQIFRKDGRSLAMHIHDSVEDKDEVSYAILVSPLLKVIYIYITLG